MPDFWRSSGYHLLDRRPEGRLVATNAFLRAYFMRPEVRPVAESCAAERALHAALSDDPRRPVGPGELAAIADADARENYALLLAFRDWLLAAPTIEDAYLGLFLSPAGGPPTPPLFIDQLAHVVLRAILEGCEDGLRVRAAELLFRPQRATVDEGRIMLADEEVVEMHAAAAGNTGRGGLLADSGPGQRRVELDVLHEGNQAGYWTRDERHDTVIELSFGRPGLDALCRVLEGWVARFLGVAVAIQPVQQIRDERWVWHVGLDAEASAIMNDLYEGRAVDEARLARVLGLFRLDFAAPSVMRADLAGRPVYLGLAMEAGGRLRLKPQNLLVNLPLAARA